MPALLNVQSYALVLVVGREDLVVRAASTNSSAICGRAPAELIGSDFTVFVGREGVSELKAILQENYPAVLPVVGTESWPYDRYQAVVFTASADELVVEIEPRQTWPRSGDYSARLNDFTADLENTTDTDDLLQQLCDGLIYHFLYERAVVLEYDNKGNALITHEQLVEGTPSLLDVRFVEEDIPEAVRRKQRQESVLHYIAGREPVVPMHGELSEAASRIVRDRLASREAGVNSVAFLRANDLTTLTILSLVVEGRLWGSVYLHSNEARYLDYQMRAFMRLCVRVAQQKIAYHISHQNLHLRENENAVRDDLYNHVVNTDRLHDGLTAGPVNLLDFLPGTTGAAICFDDELKLFGKTPSRDQVTEIMRWTKAEQRQEEPYHTDQLSHNHPSAQAYAERAAGLLYLPLDAAANHWIMWFKPEVVRTVRFGSQEHPDDPDGQRLYNINEQVIRYCSLPWTTQQIGLAEALQSFLQQTVFRRYALSRQHNLRLREAVEDLEIFSYTIGHDLRAPLRGIASFAEILREDFPDALGEEGLSHVAVIQDNAERMRQFMDDLLALSRIDRTRMRVSSFKVEELVRRVLADLRNTESKLPPCVVHTPLPPISGDRSHLHTVFTNLLSNAIKYSTRVAEPRVEVGHTGEYRAGAPVFYVADNGIGIAPEEHERIFDLFTRSQNSHAYEGTGIGLALVRRIVRHHEGEVWIESEVGRGTRVYFYTGVAAD